MNQRSLLYFLTTAEERNMTQAAKKLFISQQTLSSAIQRLEKEYHTQFFLRGPHLQLTDAGHCMVTYAREMLALENKLTDTLDEVAQNLRGAYYPGHHPHPLPADSPGLSAPVLPEVSPY
ncbi:MAG: LysR family transcriptional regulator [Acidaminococcus provencensis]|jgi:DNA-binding transcriptional LysR family regulator|uniref:LysR family transcriptional regulator n=1 Tax=Acidaminococcus provencensis TaxID=2058289 RepID=UPI0023F419A0|nr:LysR family transcriptional regulator [Acidaminococcus provencensis]MCH4095872.1 LysR family transcriptional regulator [Acidaminococcus provencensis]